jgi:hypothetical protein
VTGESGRATAIPLTSDTGAFWFFSPTNYEMMVKVLDGCSINDHEWVFMAGLTNVKVVTTVTDTRTGAVKTYTNPQGTPFQPVQDTTAFICSAPLARYPANTFQSGFPAISDKQPCNCEVINRVRKAPPAVQGLFVGLLLFGVLVLWHRRHASL